MKIHADENVKGIVVEHLRRLGHDVSYAVERAPRDSDEEVLRLATLESRILLTFDKDFGELCFRRARPSAGVLLVRSTARKPEEIAQLLQRVLERPEKTFLGYFVVVTDRAVRQRPLPPVS